jgi:3-hydroxyethyl bacteriochlorophyllide a dehydrogenase
MRVVNTDAVVVTEPGQLALRSLPLTEVGPGDVVVENLWSGVSAGTERLLWSGAMPPFPGMGYPLVPGYESVGVITEAGPEAQRRVGQRVFVPGASCYGEVRGLFGASARKVVTAGSRVVPVGFLGSEATLLALAATAYRALDFGSADVVVGHGALGRLLATLNHIRYGSWPLVWEALAARRAQATPYPLVAPGTAPETPAARIIDASGDPGIIDQVVPVVSRGAQVVLAGFYSRPVTFQYPPAFIKEIGVQIAAEFRPEHLSAVADLAVGGALDLDGIITHVESPSQVRSAYERAFTDPECVKLILDWNRAP